MALTRKFLKAMGIEDDKIDQIIDAHTETVTALKEACRIPGISERITTAGSARSTPTALVTWTTGPPAQKPLWKP